MSTDHPSKLDALSLWWRRPAVLALAAGVAIGYLVEPIRQRVSAAYFPVLDQSEFANYDQEKYWAEQLRKGGYILYFRHAQREKWLDVTAFDAVELKTGADASDASYKRAVCLTEQGVEESKIIGEVFRLANIKTSRIVSSPSCRARQTAMYAFGRIDEISNALLHRTAIMKDQHAAFAAETRRLVESLEPEPGTNAVITAHAGTMRFDGTSVIDSDETTDHNLDWRDETGFIVLEKKDGKIIARHKFHSIAYLARATIDLPVMRQPLAVSHVDDHEPTAPAESPVRPAP